MGRFHRESPAVKQFKQSQQYETLTDLYQQAQAVLAQFSDQPENVLIFLALLHRADVQFAQSVTAGQYDSSVADCADAIFIKINSLIGTTLQFNHSPQFPQFDSESKMIIAATSDNATRYWRQADMIEILYQRLFVELLHQSPGDQNSIDRVSDAKQIKLR